MRINKHSKIYKRKIKSNTFALCDRIGLSCCKTLACIRNSSFLLAMSQRMLSLWLIGAFFSIALKTSLLCKGCESILFTKRKFHSSCGHWRHAICLKQLKHVRENQMCITFLGPESIDWRGA